MINLGGIDFELNTLAPNPEFNYQQVYVERTMISGKIRRIYKGKRMTMALVYGYLTEKQISDLYGLLASQQTNGFISAAITTPSGDFSGNVMIDIDESQKRFKIVDGKGVWSNWVINLTGVDLL
jgi:hypothetical protein